MKKISISKIIVITFTISLITGMVGGALTNEYLIAYLFGQLTEKQQEDLPIVKKVIEVKTYVEESSTIKAIEKASKSLVLISDANEVEEFYLDNHILTSSGIILTTDGIVATCNSFVKNRNSWFVIFNDSETLNAQVVYRDDVNDIALLQVDNEETGKYFKTLTFNDEMIKLGQKVLALGGLSKVKSGIISYVPQLENEFVIYDFGIDPYYTCGPLVNLNGDLVGMSVNTTEQGTSNALPATAINNALFEFKKHLQ